MHVYHWAGGRARLGVTLASVPKEPGPAFLDQGAAGDLSVRRCPHPGCGVCPPSSQAIVRTAWLEGGLNTVVLFNTRYIDLAVNVLRG